MGRGGSSQGDLILVGADTYGNDTQGNNSGDDYIGAAFLFQRGNPQPIRTYYGNQPYGFMGLDTAMSSTWLAATTRNPPQVHLVGSSAGSFHTTVNQVLDIDAAVTTRLAIDITSQHLVVGAPADQGPGAVYVYSYNSWANSWNTTPTELIGSGGFNDSSFGTSVAIDGNRIIVGSPGEGGAGAVRIFERTSNGAWILRYHGSPRFSSGGGTYGAQVDISGDHAIVSDPTASITNGFVHFLGRSSGTWHSRDYELDVQPNVVTISGDKAAMGFYLDHTVTTFRRVGTNWSQMGGFYAQDDIRLGAGIDLENDFIAMGAPSYSEGVYNFKGALFTANIWESSGGFQF